MTYQNIETALTEIAQGIAREFCLLDHDQIPLAMAALPSFVSLHFSGHGMPEWMQPAFIQEVARRTDTELAAPLLTGGTA